ncbi:MAG: hypothetical protein ACYC77_06535 [Coriobacteriia bacterium]
MILRPRDRRLRSVLPALWAILALVGVGGITFLTGGVFESEEVRSGPVQLAVERLPETRPPEVITVLELSWDAGKGAGVARITDTGQSTLEAVFASGDLIYIVDHPQEPTGARIRWYREGMLVGEHRAPVSATLFTPRSAGFMYVLAKSGGPSEGVVLVAADGSVETTFTIPLGLNSGGLLESGGVLYASGISSALDLKGERQEYSGVLVPVADRGRQMTAAAAREGSVQAWTIDTAGVRYSQVLQVEGLTTDLVEQQTISRLSDGAAVSVPPRARTLGVTPAGQMVLVVPPRPVSESSVAVAGWRSTADAWQEILVATFDGRLLDRRVVPYSAIISSARSRIWLGTDALYVAVADERGIRVLLYPLDGEGR